jgi:hypothetical protein
MGLMSVTPATLEVEIKVLGQPRTTTQIHETPSQLIKVWMQWCPPLIPAIRES